MIGLFKQFNSTRNSKYFSPLLSGATFEIVGKTVAMKVEESVRIERTAGYRFAKFSFKSKIRSGVVLGHGFGEDDNELCALQKSISEAVERTAFNLAKSLQPTVKYSSTNGWAAHVNETQCRESAINELLERDAVLIHWLKEIPMVEVEPSSFPLWLKKWIGDELSLSLNFITLRLLISNAGYLPTATVVLLNHEGKSVCSHATHQNFEVAISKALTEACRIAHWFDGEAVANISRIGASQLLTDHAFYYSKYSNIPNWFFGGTLSFTEAKRAWKGHYKKFHKSNFKYDFHVVAAGPLVVGYCRSEAVQDLYLGPTDAAIKEGKINFNRLGIAPEDETINLGLHIVS